MSITFKSLSLKNWRQFKSVDIELHPRVTILTGSNGSGKSTVLNIFSQHFGGVRPILATPKLAKGGGIFYDTGYRSRSSATPWSIDGELDDDLDESEFSVGNRQLAAQIMPQMLPPMGVMPGQPAPHQPTFATVGELTYSNAQSSAVGFPENPGNAYGLTIFPQLPVQGVQIASYRTYTNYQPIQSIAMQSFALAQAYQLYLNEVNIRLHGGQSQFTPIYRMKEALIAMAAFGEGNSFLQRNEELLASFEGFNEVLRVSLPVDIGFQRIIIRLPDIVLKTRSGEFILDASSGGLSAIIEISWQVFLFSRQQDNFVVTIDEPENHLHPSMQRSIIPNLIKAFPRVQFIIATHSPFVVSSVEDSAVYALRYSGSSQAIRGLSRHQRVTSVALDQINKAGPAADILREVLGVPTTMPDWVEGRLSGLVDEYRNREINKETLQSLRDDLKEAGFADFYPEALARIMRK